MEAGTVICVRAGVNFELNTEGQTIKSPCLDKVAVVCIKSIVLHLLFAINCEAGNVVAKKTNLNYRGVSGATRKCAPSFNVACSCFWVGAGIKLISSIHGSKDVVEI